MARLRALAVVHPFPSALDAGVTGLIALLAGGTAEQATLLAVAMLFLQFGIGAANDWADAPIDAIGRPLKPIVLGVVSMRQAAGVAVASAATGLLLAAFVGLAALLSGAAGLLVGIAYDLGLKRTPWAWLAFAGGFVLLPVFAWLGAAGTVPPFAGWIALLALPAGAIVSLANGLVDVDGDEAVGRLTPAVRLGRWRSLIVLVVLEAVLAVGAALGMALAGRAPPGAWAGLVAGAGLQGAGWLVSTRPSRDARLQGWRIEAVGLAVLAGAWFLGMT